MGRHSTITVVTAVHDVAGYLPAFFASLEGQRGVDPAAVQVVAVDDGSTDDSLAVLRRLAERSPLDVTVLTQHNGGQGSARNLGLEHARGEWVTFTDPDDVLEPGYLAAVLGFVREHPDVELVATRRVFLDDSTGRRRDAHDLRGMFASGDRLVDLSTTRGLFHGSAPAAFVRRERVEALGLRFDERIRPNFEDGHFCTRYLLACDRPLVGFVASAVYLYRRRADGSSTVQTSSADPRRYTDVPRYGFLDVLAEGARRYGRAPAWVQDLVLYELSWYFAAERRAGVSTAATGAVGQRFVDLLRAVREHLDDAVVASFDARPLDPVVRAVLLHGLTGRPWCDRPERPRTDRAQGLTQVVTRFAGPVPAVRYEHDGVPVEPVHGKVRTHTYFDAVLLREHVAWLPDRPGLTVRVDDGPAVEPTAPAAPAGRETTAGRRGAGGLRALRTEPRRVLGAARARARGLLAVLARTPPVRARLGAAWVLVDRVREADDNAEHLFRYLRTHRPDVDAWFVVAAGTPDHARLRAEFGRRVVSYGGLRWTLLMFAARHVVSSHVDTPVHRPRRIVWALGDRPPPWRFTFLQHGVVKDDISAWLNDKEIDLFVTSTPAEHASVVGDGTGYAVTTKEVRRTGLPRFDRLRAVAASLTDADRDLVLVAPTWRSGLLGPYAPRTGERAVRADLADTEFARQWLAFLGSADLADLAAAHGLRIGFLPHPLLQPALPRLGLPAHVERLTFEGAGAQRMFAGAAVLVTDWSSTAFNAAYVDRPVVYFQFDADSLFAGGHVGRAGYFDYERDGFGPVVRTAQDAVAAVRTLVEAGCRPSPEHLARIAATFPDRDGRCCERVVAQIEALDRPWTAAVRAVPRSASK